MSEHDDLSEPSFFAKSTREMRIAGGEALLRIFAEMQLEPNMGPYTARGVAAEIFAAMVKAGGRSLP